MSTVIERFFKNFNEKWVVSSAIGSTSIDPVFLEIPWQFLLKSLTVIFVLAALFTEIHYPNTNIHVCPQGHIPECPLSIIKQ